MSSIGDLNGVLTRATVLTANARSANVTTATGGVSVDLKDFIGSVAVVYDAGAITNGDSNSTFTIRLQHSDEANANFVNINTNITLTNAASAGQVGLHTRSLNRYLAVVGNVAGANTPVFPCSVQLVGFKQITA
jgi:hypothetical protein